MQIGQRSLTEFHKRGKFNKSLAGSLHANHVQIDGEQLTRVRHNCTKLLHPVTNWHISQDISLRESTHVDTKTLNNNNNYDKQTTSARTTTRRVSKNQKHKKDLAVAKSQLSSVSKVVVSQGRGELLSVMLAAGVWAGLHYNYVCVCVCMQLLFAISVDWARDGVRVSKREAECECECECDMAYTWCKRRSLWMSGARHKNKSKNVVTKFERENLFRPLPESQQPKEPNESKEAKRAKAKAKAETPVVSSPWRLKCCQQ